jgi:HAD superfamily hydrolase (TIGR01509 family)
MDGTIINSMPFHEQSWLQTLAERGVHISAEELQRANRGTIDEVIRRIMGDGLSDTQVNEIASRKEACFREIYRPHLRLIDGLDAFLEEIGNLDIPTALATNAGDGNISFVLDGLGIHSKFPVVVGAKDVQLGKPDPEIYHITSVRLGVPPERCIVFEDSHSGVEAAYRAKMKVVAITTSLEVGELNGHPAIIRVIDNYTTICPQALLV